MFRRTQHLLACAVAAAFCGVVVWAWGAMILAVPLPLPHVPMPAVQGLLVRMETEGVWKDLWRQRLEIDGDGTVRYFEKEDGTEKLRGEGRLSVAQLEEISQSFAMAEFCDGPRYVSKHEVAYVSRRPDWILTYYGCSPPRTLHERELPIRGWWWPRTSLPWDVCETTGLTQYFNRGRSRK